MGGERAFAAAYPNHAHYNESGRSMAVCAGGMGGEHCVRTVDLPC